MSLQKAVYGFIPTSITGCALWLDGADPAGNGVVPGTGTLATWVDKSGNGFNASSQLTAATSTQNAVNGLNSISFNGTSRYLTSVTGFNNSAYTIFVVQYTTSITGAGGSSGYQRTVHGSTGNQYVFIGTYNGNVATFSGSGSAWNDVAANSTNVYNYNSSRIVCMQVSGSILSPYTDGSSQTTKTGTTGSFSSFYIGNDNANTQPWYGFISEIVIYNSALGNTQRQQVEGYLAQKWGLTSSLPSSHPGLTTTVYRSDYTKQNVMRALPYYAAFTPRQIPGCALWLDGADPAGNGVIPANGATVSTWVDKSGNSKNGTQVNNPTYDLASKAIYFSGSSQYYTLPDSTFPIGNTSYSYFIIANFTSLGTGSGTSIWAGVLGGGGFTPSTSIAFRTNGAGGGFYEYWYANDIFSSTTYAINQIVAIESFYTSGGQRSLIQNFSVTTTNTPSTPRNQSAGNNVIGRTFSNEYMMGYIHEVIVYNSALGTTERQQVESYLAQKWGLTASLPGGHSHATQPAGAITRTALANLRLVIQPRRYTSFRWTITAGTTDGLIQFSEFQVGFNNTQLVFASPTTATTGSTISWNTGAGEGPAQAVDNNLNTKGLGIGTSGLVLIVTVATPIAANMYRWATANDVTPGRNPTQWTVDGSVNGTTFVRLHTQNTTYASPSSTFTFTSWIPFTYS